MLIANLNCKKIGEPLPPFSHCASIEKDMQRETEKVIITTRKMKMQTSYADREIAPLSIGHQPIMLLLHQSAFVFFSCLKKVSYK